MALARKLLPFILLFAGFALLIHGLDMVYPPAKWVLTGLLLIAAGLVSDWERDRP